MPVFNFFTVNPSLIRASESPFAGISPSLPAGKDCNPIKILPFNDVPVVKTTALALYCKPNSSTTPQILSSWTIKSTIVHCLICKFSCFSSKSLTNCMYSFLSDCALKALTAGPLLKLSIFICKYVASAAIPIIPPRASISLTRLDFAGPPIAGLQGIMAMFSIFKLVKRVFAPSLEAAIAASHPA